jgi:hypothetical protein
MSFDRNEIARLRLFGGAVLAKYERLVAAADHSAHLSPAQLELAEFCQAWIADPTGTAAAAEADESTED